MGFFRQEYWSELPCPPPGNLPDPGIEPVSLESAALAGGFFTTVPPGKPRGKAALTGNCPARGGGTLIPSAQRLVWA